MTMQFDARPPRARNLDGPVTEPEAEWEPPIPAGRTRMQLRDMANLIVHGLTYGETMDGLCLKIESDSAKANELAAKLNRWANEFLREGA